MTRIDTRRSRSPARWWPPFLAGAAAGLLAGLLARGSGPARERRATAPEPRTWMRLRGAWDGAVEGASEGLASARQLIAPGEPLDPDLLHGVLRAAPGAAECRVRVLADGIVEVVGSCASDEELAEILAALAAVPGVDVVVNRVWTPDSSAPSGAAGTPPAH